MLIRRLCNPLRGRVYGERRLSHGYAFGITRGKRDESPSGDLRPLNLKLVTLNWSSPLIQSAVYMATEAQKAALLLLGEDFYVAAGVYAVARRGVVGKVCHAEHVVFDIHVCAL